MPFDREKWRSETFKLIEGFATDPQAVLEHHGEFGIAALLMGCTMMPLAAAYAQDPNAAIGALLDATGNRGARLLAHLFHGAYNELDGLSKAAAEAASAEMRPAYLAIARTLNLFPLADECLAAFGQQHHRDLLRAELASINLAFVPGGDQPSGGDTVYGDKIEGDLVMGDKIVNNYTAPINANAQQLQHYLRRLAARLQRLPLRGLAPTLDDGPGMALPSLAITLTTTNQVLYASDAEQSDLVAACFQGGDRGKPLLPAHDPEHAQPEYAIVRIEPLETAQGGVALWRAELLNEAVASHQRLVVLAPPGGGKSTALRHIAWALAQQGETAIPRLLPGWPDDLAPIPLLLPLRRVAQRIAAEEPSANALSVALGEELTQHYDLHQPQQLLSYLFSERSVLLLLDGLDELPSTATAHLADQQRTLDAVRDFAELYPHLRIVMTSRERMLTAKMRSALGWPTVTLAPLTGGQIAQFIVAWHAALAEQGRLSAAQATARADALQRALATDERLRQLASNPLLLTMLAIPQDGLAERVHDRPQLYEQIIGQLLGAWEQDKGGQTLAQAVSAEHLHAHELRASIDLLSYQAHASDAGHLDAAALRYRLTEFFGRRGVEGAWEAAGRCITWIEQRGGLLLPDADGQTYRFAHASLQAYGAGRHLVLQPNAAELVMRHRHDERWREPIALGLGALHRLHPELADRLQRILIDLIDIEERGQPKPTARWYRDLIFAAELGQERDWAVLEQSINTARLRRELRNGLVELLEDVNQPLPIAERVRAALLLGQLGDPRYPVEIAQWQQAIADARAGHGSYFRRLPTSEGEPPRWIARFPLTNQQLRVWLPERSAVRSLHDPHYHAPNQPVAGISWHEARKLCAQMSKALGVVLRLPTGEEWQRAASGDTTRAYPWGEHYRADRAATKSDVLQRNWPYTVPVGCYPAGASPIGALDMSGNVWEWTADLSDPTVTGQAKRSQARVLRGGGSQSTRQQTKISARIAMQPSLHLENGVRLLLELPEGE